MLNTPVLLLGALFSDIETELCTKRQQEAIDDIGFAEVLYADDTKLFGAKSSRSSSVQLKGIPSPSFSKWIWGGGAPAIGQ